jgi:hypothetical protein
MMKKMDGPKRAISLKSGEWITLIVKPFINSGATFEM